MKISAIIIGLILLALFVFDKLGVNVFGSSSRGGLSDATTLLPKFKPRVQDKWGQGHFNAPRGGSRLHKGVDIVDNIKLNLPVKINRLGKTYPDSKNNDLLEIIPTTGPLKNSKVKLMHVDIPEPIAKKVGQTVEPKILIAKPQNLQDRFPQIIDHVHIEMQNSSGVNVDPTPYLGALEVPEENKTQSMHNFLKAPVNALKPKFTISERIKKVFTLGRPLRNGVRL